MRIVRLYRGALFLFLPALAWLYPLPARAGDQELPLLTIEQVRSLPTLPAAPLPRVRIRAVVTYSRPRGPAYIQDATGAIFVRRNQTAAAVRRGQLVEITGAVTHGSYARLVTEESVQILGQARLPVPVEPPLDALGDGAYHCRWAQVSGVVRAISGTTGGAVHTILAAGGGRVVCRSFGVSRAEAARLIGARIRVRGVLGGRANDQEQLVEPLVIYESSADIELERGAVPGRDAEPSPISELRRFRTQAENNLRVKVTGIVTCRQSSRTFYLQDESGGVRIETVDDTPVQPGDRAVVKGFPSMGLVRPYLEDSTVEVAGRGDGPGPVPLVANQAASGKYDQRLVTTEAELLDITAVNGQKALLLQSGPIVLTAWLPAVAGRAWRPPPIGSVLRTTGVWTVDYSQEPNLDAVPRAFHVILRSPSDLAVLKQPSWWTMRRLLGLLLAISACALAAAAWVWTLRRKIRQQTAVILRKAEMEAVAEERQRIARDFHDTLQQDLVGVMMQLNAAAARLPAEPAGLARSLEFARQLLRRSIDGIRASVWDLRFRPLEAGALPTALTASLDACYGSQSPIHVQVTGNPQKLPTGVETHLLRIAEEAVVNAVKHSGTVSIRVELDYMADTLRLRVTDDGCGFDPQSPRGPREGAHFGFISMRDRAAKIGGRLNVRSAPGQGTEIEIEVGLRHDRDGDADNQPAAASRAHRR